MSDKPPTNAVASVAYTLHQIACSIDDKETAVDLERLANRLDRLSSQPRGSADEPRAILLDKSLRQYAHDIRIEACAAWSDCIKLPRELDVAKCEYAKTIEDKLRNAIDELADLSKSVEQRDDVAPFLDALDGYIDYGYASWRKHGMPANTAADLAKHMASAVIGIRRRLGLSVIDPKKYLPGFRDWAKQSDTKNEPPATNTESRS